MHFNDMESDTISSGRDFLVQPENNKNGKQSDTTLNFWEYIDKDNQRTHICPWINFDEINLLIKRLFDPAQRRIMLLTFQDRLRIPWRGGAKQISLDMIAPVIVIPLLIIIAGLNANMACLCFVSCSAFLIYACHYLKRNLPRSKFFFMWAFWSVLYMLIFFELTVDSMELLPEENLVLVILTLISVYCLYKTKQRAPLNHVVQSTVDEDELPDITEEEEQQTSLLMERGSDDERNQPTICQICRKYVQPRTSHCTVCQACIVRRDHHSYWLDCCIGESNHRFYMLGLLFAELGLLTGINLTLTSICHPILLGRVLNIPIMLPDDCSDVFDEYELAISFVVAIYALFIGAYILFILVKQCYFISRGTLMSECRRSQTGNRKIFLSNWKAFIS